jgi:hypothetical protein
MSVRAPGCPIRPVLGIAFDGSRRPPRCLPATEAMGVRRVDEQLAGSDRVARHAGAPAAGASHRPSRAITSDPAVTPGDRSCNQRDRCPPAGPAQPGPGQPRRGADAPVDRRGREAGRRLVQGVHAQREQAQAVGHAATRRTLPVSSPRRPTRIPTTSRTKKGLPSNASAWRPPRYSASMRRYQRCSRRGWTVVSPSSSPTSSAWRPRARSAAMRSSTAIRRASSRRMASARAAGTSGRSGSAGPRHQLVLPSDPARADAVVSVGHVVNCLPDEAAVIRALRVSSSARERTHDRTGLGGAA